MKYSTVLTHSASLRDLCHFDSFCANLAPLSLPNELFQIGQGQSKKITTSLAEAKARSASAWSRSSGFRKLETGKDIFTRSHWATAATPRVSLVLQSQQVATINEADWDYSNWLWLCFGLQPAISPSCLRISSFRPYFSWTSTLQNLTQFALWWASAKISSPTVGSRQD